VTNERLGRALSSPGETKVLLYPDGKHCKPVSATVVWFTCSCPYEDSDECEVMIGLVDEHGTSWDDVGELFVDVEQDFTEHRGGLR